MKKRMVYVAVVLLVLLLPVLALAILSASARRPDNLGAPAGKLADCAPSPNCVCSQGGDAHHHIEPLPFTCPPEEAWARLKAVLLAMPRTQIVTESPNYLHAEATSRIFRFVDDVEFVLDGAARVIHCRSASRVGRSDLGVNRQRLEHLRATLAQLENQ